MPKLARRLGDFLKERRLKLGLSRADLAASTGISVDTLAKYENSPQVPSAGKLAMLCLRLKIDPREALWFSLGEGEGERIAKSDPQLWADYTAFMEQLRDMNLPDLAGGLKMVRFILDMIEATTRHAGPTLDQHSGNLNDLLDNFMPAMMPDALRAVISDDKVTAHFTPEARDLLAGQMKSGSDQSDPSRPETKPTEVLPAPSTRSPKPTRAKPAAKQRGKQGARVK